MKIKNFIDISAGLSNTFKELFNNNVKIITANKDYFLMHQTDKRINLILFSNFTNLIQIDYSVMIDGVSFPAINIDFNKCWENIEDKLKNGFYYCFFRSPSIYSVKSYQQRCKNDIFEKYGIKKNIIYIAIPENVISERIGEVISLLYFRKNGYVSTNKYASSYMVRNGYGIPDVICWNDEFIDDLREYGCFSYGTSLTELAFLRHLKRERHIYKNRNKYSIVVEVENNRCGAYGGILQLTKRKETPDVDKKSYFIHSKMFDEGYIMCPFNHIDNHKDIGSLSFDRNGLLFTKSKRPLNDFHRKNKFLEELKHVIKNVIASGLTLNEIERLVGRKTSINSMLKEINKLPIDKILDTIYS